MSATFLGVSVKTFAAISAKTTAFAVVVAAKSCRKESVS